MMRATDLLKVCLSLMILRIVTSLPAETERQKRAVERNAFSNDINACLFTAWTTASGAKNAVLSKPVACKGQAGSAVQLCYSISGTSPAQFAVCYNKITLTPDFSGHIVRPNIAGSGRESAWTQDKGPYAPNPQARDADYASYAQRGLYDNYNIDMHQFCAKGHLTPNADFKDDAERSLTMITTNIAPQWQKFNSKNWAGLEAAVRAYATKVNRDVFVFTGVGGVKRNLQGVKILMNRRVETPMWYWKAVCDPVAKQSIVFVGENAVGVASKPTDPKVAGCNGIQQTKDQGVVYCYSLEGALKSYKLAGFKFPPFNQNCSPAVRGNFMNPFLDRKLS